MGSRPQDIKLFSCSTQLSMNFFKLLIKTKMLNNKDFSGIQIQNVFIMLIIVKVSTIVGILTFMMKNFMLS